MAFQGRKLVFHVPSRMIRLLNFIVLAKGQGARVNHARSMHACLSANLLSTACPRIGLRTDSCRSLILH